MMISAFKRFYLLVVGIFARPSAKLRAGTAEAISGGHPPEEEQQPAAAQPEQSDDAPPIPGTRAERRARSAEFRRFERQRKKFDKFVEPQAKAKKTGDHGRHEERPIIRTRGAGQ